MAPLGGVRTINVLSGGVMRSAQLFVPMTYDPTRAYPVVLGFHGYLEDPNAFARESSLDRRGPEHGYITVLPAGLNNSWNAGACCGTSRANNVNDVQFVRDLIAWLRSHACIDRRRIFATGFSNGGMLSHRLACELSDQIAAVAPTSGVIVTQNCAPSRPISVLHSHGTRDLVVPYNGSPVLQFPPVVDTMRGWASRNLCEMSLQEIFNRGDARCVRYPNCRDGVETIRCDVANGGHTWPGGNNIAAAGYTSRDLDATAFILDFFDRHPLP
jgi:polyhydroxybutyrate depolymerase